MRLVAALAGCALLAPGLASASAECDNLARNIQRFETMAERAKDANRSDWEEHLLGQAERFEERRKARCGDAVLASSLECSQFTRNIAYYEEIAERASQLRNPRWEETTLAHVELLKDERAERCPEWSPEAQAQRLMLELLKVAGQAALQYFTMGAF